MGGRGTWGEGHMGGGYMLHHANNYYLSTVSSPDHIGTQKI